MLWWFASFLGYIVGGLGDVLEAFADVFFLPTFVGFADAFTLTATFLKLFVFLFFPVVDKLFEDEPGVTDDYLLLPET